MFYCKFKTISYSLLLSKFEFDVPLSLLPKESVALYPQCEAVVLWGWWKGAKAWECKLSRGGVGERGRGALPRQGKINGMDNPSTVVNSK